MKNTIIILSAVIFLIPLQLSYADYDSFTVNVPNAQGGYTALLIKQSGSGYVGPQGEYYSQFPSVAQLQAVYGLNTPNPTAIINTYQQPSTSQADDDDISVPIAPPDLPVYVQPESPGPDYVWTPGYWAYNSFFEDYYWVPGTWVLAPSEGLLWTPGYWYCRNGAYVYSNGYWGHHVGFYGGIKYGYGYGANGSSGGPSFNGGPGGTNARPTFAEQAAMKENHVLPTAVQTSHVHAATQNTALRASMNHGMPAIAATAKPGVFKGNAVVAARPTGTFYKNTKPVIATHVQTKPKPKVKKPLPQPQTPSTNVVPKLLPNPGSDTQNKQQQP